MCAGIGALLEVTCHEVGQLRKWRASVDISGRRGHQWKPRSREPGDREPTNSGTLPAPLLVSAACPMRETGCFSLILVSRGWRCLAAARAPWGRDVGNPTLPGAYAGGQGGTEPFLGLCLQLGGEGRMWDISGNYLYCGWKCCPVSMLCLGGML